MSRAELEDITQDLIARVKSPLQTALEAANMTIVSIKKKCKTLCVLFTIFIFKDDIKSVILVGGGVRVPAIQDQLNNFVGR